MIKLIMVKEPRRWNTLQRDIFVFQSPVPLIITGRADEELCCANNRPKFPFRLCIAESPFERQDVPPVSPDPFMRISLKRSKARHGDFYQPALFPH